VDHSRPDSSSPAPDPEAFVALETGRLRLVVAPRWETALRGAGLTDAERLGALIDGLVPTPGRGAGRASTHVLHTEAGSVLLKRALKGGALGPLYMGRIPRFARAADEIEATAALYERGAPVLEPVLAAGVRDGLGWRAVVGTLFRPDSSDGATALARATRDVEIESANDRPGHALARHIGHAVRAFHDAGGTHADLAITNLLVDDGDGTVRVIDLQGAGVGAPPNDRRRQRELSRLERSIAHRPAIRSVLDELWPVLEAAYAAPRARTADAVAGARLIV